MSAYESWRVYLRYSGVWQDVTSYVDTVRTPIDIVCGRQTNRDDVRPAQLSLLLRNADQRFSPGNTTSVWALQPGQEIQVVDVAGCVEYPLFTGNVEFPSIDSWQKSSTEAPRDQTLAITAVDRLGRLERDRAMHSTLAEHILANGGSALKAYWMLSESAPPAVNLVDGSWALREEQTLFGSEAPNDPTAPSIEYAHADPAPGDDVRAVQFHPSRDTVNGLYIRSIALAGTRETVLTLGAGQVATLVAWIRVDSLLSTSFTRVLQLLLGTGSTFSASIRFSPGTGSVLTGAAASLDWSGTVNGPPVASGALVPVALRFGFSPAVIELWTASGLHTSTMTVTTATPTDINAMKVGVSMTGAVAHLQLYLGAAGDWDRDNFLAQVQMGFQGLHRQRVDERITTLAGYAGVSVDDLELDEAAALMPAARLAGMRPVHLVRAAADTDNGQLFTNGRGRVVFHGRARRYNPPLAATIDLSWLEEPLPFRTDPPVNTMTATSTPGAQGHSVDQDSVDALGQYAAPSRTLDTVCEVDPVNLAAFTTRIFDQPRQRSPRLLMQLRHQSDAVRQTILGRELSDRCRLAGLPDNAPRGTEHFHIEGIHHRISVYGHEVGWNTGPVLGEIHGVPDPYPKVGSAVVAAETRIPF